MDYTACGPDAPTLCALPPAGPPAPAPVPADPKRGARLREANGAQMAWGRIDLEADLPDDHPARALCAVIERLDPSALYAPIEARNEVAGAPAIDPQLLLGLWVYARQRARDLAADAAARGVSVDLRRRRGRLPHAERRSQPAGRGGQCADHAGAGTLDAAGLGGPEPRRPGRQTRARQRGGVVGPP